ncbi:MAG: ABC transporter ATP-binding protein [Candidatus Geothermarchaeales archaeon]
MSRVVVEDLWKSFDSFEAVRGVGFSVDGGGFVTLLGPSGCGKTTILRCIAGVEEPDQGEISIGGRVVLSTREKIFVPPEEREVGMVYQSYALWPHMSVYANVAYPLGVRGVPKEEVQERVAEALEVVHLSGLDDRLSPHLSAGQQQRVALARALVYKPRVLLLDEPLSNLDAPLREEMREELKEIQNRTGVTTVYVTHDRSEALTMSDRVILMSEGAVRSSGNPVEMIENPDNSYEAKYLAGMVVLDGEVMGRSEGGRLLISTGLGRLGVGGISGAEGDQGKVCLRGELLELHENRPEAVGGSVLEATVRSVTYEGMRGLVKVEAGESPFSVSSPLLRARGLSQGSKVYVEIPDEAVLFLHE